MSMPNKKDLWNLAQRIRMRGRNNGTLTMVFIIGSRVIDREIIDRRTADDVNNLVGIYNRDIRLPDLREDLQEAFRDDDDNDS